MLVACGRGQCGPVRPRVDARVQHDQIAAGEVGGEAVGPQRDYLTLVVGDEEYAIAIDRIREIIKVRPVTEVPHVPGFVVGIISVRGTIVPVLDLRQRLRLSTSGLSRAARFLIVAREDELFGLLVDEVRQVVRPVALQVGQGTRAPSCPSTAPAPKQLWHWLMPCALQPGQGTAPDLLQTVQA